MDLRALLNVAYADREAGMTGDALEAWHAETEPAPGRPGSVTRQDPQNRNVAALLAISKRMPRR